MKTKLASPFAQMQQQMSTLIYANQDDKPGAWRCSSRISEQLALSIYQQNLHGGGAQHLQTHFPVTYAYIGSQAYQAISAGYLKASPPNQPLFALYTAHFPGYLFEYGEQNPEQLIWSVAARLAQIDFFHNNASCSGQSIDVEDHFYQLWVNIRSMLDNHEEPVSTGYYCQPNLHPEHYQHIGKTVSLVTFWKDEELFFMQSELNRVIA